MYKSPEVKKKLWVFQILKEINDVQVTEYKVDSGLVDEFGDVEATSL